MENKSLYLHMKKVVNGKIVSTSKALAKGKHKVQIDYFQGPRTRIALLLEYSSPSMTKTVIGNSVLSH